MKFVPGDASARRKNSSNALEASPLVLYVNALSPTIEYDFPENV